MSQYANIQARLQAAPKSWLVTGAAGFIGSHLVEQLLKLGQTVTGLDNFATGHKRNLMAVRDAVGPEAWTRFHFICGDLCDATVCQAACEHVEVVLHHAALGSVPLSIADPVTAHRVNAGGTVNLLAAARTAGVRRFVYASTSAIYGDLDAPVMTEERIGRALSPYAVSKHENELCAGVFARCYGLETAGLRYFNVFGPRQDPNGAYAAVIPKWFAAFLLDEPVVIFGDGQTSRDFCHVDDVVQANLLAATVAEPAALNRAYNVATGSSATLNELFSTLRELLGRKQPALLKRAPVMKDFRPGDVRHSRADISAARKLLGYEPQRALAAGLEASLDYYTALAGQDR
jgi:UDP-N-acetylglucosamine 4-epimerase